MRPSSSWLRCVAVALALGGCLLAAPDALAQSEGDWWDVLDDIAAGSGSSGDAGWAEESLLDVNCADFVSWIEAQEFFEQNGGPGGDVFGLDADGDGVACESLG
jgi:hypothetical protein